MTTSGGSYRTAAWVRDRRVALETKRTEVKEIVLVVILTIVVL